MAMHALFGRYIIYYKIHTIKDFKFTDMFSEEMGELVCRKKTYKP